MNRVKIKKLSETTKLPSQDDNFWAEIKQDFSKSFRLWLVGSITAVIATLLTAAITIVAIFGSGIKNYNADMNDHNERITVLEEGQHDIMLYLKALLDAFNITPPIETGV